jgi:hypothetical protein
VAATADLITMAAALSRDIDLQRLPALRRILELETDRAALVTPQARRTPTPQEVTQARTATRRREGRRVGDPGVRAEAVQRGRPHKTAKADTPRTPRVGVGDQMTRSPTEGRGHGSPGASKLWSRTKGHPALRYWIRPRGEACCDGSRAAENSEFSCMQKSCSGGPPARGRRALRDALYECERSVSHFAPAVVDGEGVPTVGDRGDLGDRWVVPLLLERGAGDRPWDRVVFGSVDDQ